MLHDLLSSTAVDVEVFWRPCAEPVYVSVAHAKNGGDENCVVNLPIGRTMLTGGRHIFLCYLLSTLLHFARDVQ